MKGRLRLLLRLLYGSLFERNAVRVPLSLKRVGVMAFFLPLFLGGQLLHWIGFLLDELLFPKYRQVEVRRPLFIVGVPRSGTTLLHRVVARDTERYTTFTLWELLIAPSITERVFWRTLARVDRCVGRPFGRLMGWLERLFFRDLSSVHPSSLYAPEEDYFALVPVFACFLLVLPFPSSGMIWQLAYFDHQVPEADKRRIMAFYKSCLQRHLYVHGEGKRLLSKNPSFTPAVGALRETFPDCRVVCCMRNPLEAIPSQLSSMRQGTRLFYGAEHEDVLRDRFLDLLNHYYHYALSELSTWPPERHEFVTLEEMQGNVRASVERIYDRFGDVVSPAYEEALEEEDCKSRAYKSRHRYSLEQFGIEPHSVVEDLSHVFERFGFSRPVEEVCEAGR